MAFSFGSRGASLVFLFPLLLASLDCNTRKRIFLLGVFGFLWPGRSGFVWERVTACGRCVAVSLRNCALAEARPVLLHAACIPAIKESFWPNILLPFDE